MDQTWSGSPNGHDGPYHGNQEWGFPAQNYQQNLNEAAAWNQDPFQQPDAPDGFGGFQGDLQYDGQASQGDFQYDDQGSQADGHYEVESNQGHALKEKVDEMVAGGVYQCLIPSQADYYMESRINRELKELKRAGAMGPDMDEVSMQYWVGQLFLAFKNVEDIKDKPCKNGKPAQAAQRLGGSYYPDKAIEMACWTVVMDCSKAHFGIRLVELHHGTKVEHYKTFEERMEMIVDVCKTSKATCKQLLDPPYHLRLIDAPENEGAVKENNRRLNHKRDIQNLIGRQAMKEKNIKIEDLIDPDSDLDEAYGSENEDGENDYFTTPTSNKKRTPASKRRSTSGRTPSKKADFSGEQETTPLSLKRKRRAVSSKNYREGDEDKSEDSDVSEYDGEDDRGKSSSKRSATKFSRAMAASPTPTRPHGPPRRAISDKRLPGTLPVRTQSQDDPESASYDQAHDASGSGSNEQRLGASSSGSHDQGSFSSGSHDQLHGVPSSSSSIVPLAYDIPGPASDNDDAAKMEDKLILCDLLQVDRQLAQHYTLQELRTYARAYNLQFATDFWQMTTHDGKKHTCKMFRIVTGNGFVPHFCMFLYKLAYLAVSRGDLNADATYNSKSVHMSGFSTDGDVRKDMALGVIPNPFGMTHPQLLESYEDEGYAGFE